MAPETTTPSPGPHPQERKSPKDRYVAWVGEQYQPNLLDPDNINRFRSPPAAEGCTLTLEERAYLYVFNGFPLMLDGGTGTGKTTLAENLAVRLRIPYYREEGHEKFTLRRALVDPQLQDGRTTMYPGTLTLAAIYSGFWFLEECANISPEGMVELHSVLQGKQVNVPTQEGNVTFDLSKIENFRIAAAGNFTYQRPKFTDATLQRFAWVRLPYMSKKDFTDGLQDEAIKKGRVGTSSDKIAEMERKFEDLFSRREVTEAHIEALAKMLATIREKADEQSVELDQNPACYKRAQRCYSPGLSVGDFIDIMRETVVYPIAARDMFLGRGEKARAFEKIVADEVRANKNLFAERHDAVRRVGIGRFGVNIRRNSRDTEQER